MPKVPVWARWSRVASQAMYPVLFHLGALPVPTHDFFTVLGLLVATAVVLVESRHRGMADRSMATIAVGGLLGAAIGARRATGGST